MCPSAWFSMREFVESLARGEGNFYDGWMKNPTMMVFVPLVSILRSYKYETSIYDGINYIVVNPKEAVFLKEIDNRHIPQYLLYDRFGKLLDTNALKPGTQEISEIINNLME